MTRCIGSGSAILKSGQALGMFPEGHRTYGKDLFRLKVERYISYKNELSNYSNCDGWRASNPEEIFISTSGEHYRMSLNFSRWKIDSR